MDSTKIRYKSQADIKTPKSLIMLKLVILGSTGNLGTQTLEVLKKYKENFKIIGISGFENKELLGKQAKKWNVPKENIVLAQGRGPEALKVLCELPEVDVVINVLSGLSGIEPTQSALKANKTVILGNKESLVANGENIMKLADKNLIPLDSEHNAIHEILKKYAKKEIKRIILPCSGGPFLNKTKQEIEKATLKNVLAHPRWNMGPKITVESALWLNKGLEVIEAHYLFNLPLEKIDVLLHPDCLVHGMVEFADHPKIIAYISQPDMREHIENTLLEALEKAGQPQEDVHHFGPSPREIRPIQNPLTSNEFHFLTPDHQTFPGIKIILNHFRKDPTSMTNFLQKEEKTIQDFLNKKISFNEISEKLKY